MKKLYSNFQTEVYNQLNVYNNTEHSEVFKTMFNNVVKTNPNPNKRSKHSLRVVEYKDFQAIETKNNFYGCYWTLVYKQTNEVISTNQTACDIGWFVYWYYTNQLNN